MRLVRWVAAAAVVLAGGCGTESAKEKKAAVEAAPAKTPVEQPATRPAPTDIASEDVTIATGSRSFGGTVTGPPAAKSAPAVLLIAGSGPTDRDWNSPALPGSNGSGKLIAEELARRGIVVLRYDKTTSKKNPPPPGFTYDLFRDEARAALALLRDRPEVDRAHLFVAGHSEGGIQALRVAQEEKDLAGVILLSSAGRRIADVMLGQLEQQFGDAVKMKAMSAAEAEKELGPLRAGFADFTAGKEVDPMKMSSIPAIQQMLMPIMSTPAAPVGRPWVSFDPAGAVAAIAPPVLILNGDKDAQVDPELDARRLEKARREAGKPVELVIVKDANHVYKLETRSMAEIRVNLAEATNLSYAREGIGLAPGLIDAVAGWIAKQ
jgi:pimeloyl-ACP methyl ester carboxylesterase